jgi:hypothetical protein
MEADNYQKIKDEHTANFHGKIIAKWFIKNTL